MSKDFQYSINPAVAGDPEISKHLGIIDKLATEKAKAFAKNQDDAVQLVLDRNELPSDFKDLVDQGYELKVEVKKDTGVRTVLLYKLIDKERIHD